MQELNQIVKLILLTGLAALIWRVLAELDWPPLTW
jgi:hypothetical protein